MTVDTLAKLRREIEFLEEALRAEQGDSIHFESALRFYADGGNDGGARARDALEATPSDVHVHDLLQRGVAVASQFMDTGRGDLDGWIASAEAVVDSNHGDA